MADYWVYHGAAGAGTGADWANAYTSLANASARLVSGNRIFIADDHVDPATGAAKNYVGPSSGLPCYLISCDRADTGSVPAYKLGTTSQLNTSDGEYTLTIDGSFALYGLTINSGRYLYLAADDDEIFYADSCTFKPGPDFSLIPIGALNGNSFLKNCTISCANDTAGSTNPVIFTYFSGFSEIDGLSLASVSNRTGAFIGVGGNNHDGRMKFSGADLSALPSSCELVNIANWNFDLVMTNCRTNGTWTAFTGAATSGGNYVLSNVGPADAPASLITATARGQCRSYVGDSVGPSGLIYRTGCATVEGDNTSWLITTTASCGEGAPFQTPWIYGVASSPVSTNFDVYFTHDSVAPISGALMDDSKIWIEVEYLGTADEANWTLASNHRVINATAAAHTTDSSTWNGTGPSFTYKGMMRKTVTIGEAGQYRVRVCVGVASITSSAFLYIDPKVTLS